MVGPHPYIVYRCTEQFDGAFRDPSRGIVQERSGELQPEHPIHDPNCLNGHTWTPPEGSFKRVPEKQRKVVFLPSEAQPPAAESRVDLFAGPNFRGLNPAHSMRFLLILAGIETNPGPAASCDECHKRIRRDQPHLACPVPDCLAICHKKKPCSYMTRKETEDGGEWKCRMHDPGKPTRVTPSQCQQPSPVPCPACMVPLKESPFECTTCKRQFHQTCSGITNRYERLKRRSDWKCQDCGGASQPVVTTNTQQARGPKVVLRCLMCKSAITKRHLKCKTCEKVCHQKFECSRISTRCAQSKAVDSETWECTKCVEKGSCRPDNPPLDKDDITEKSEQRSRHSLERSLRILQWNTEGLNTKVE